jgi:hypothetical protein
MEPSDDGPLDADALTRCGLPGSSYVRGIHVSWLGAYDWVERSVSNRHTPCHSSALRGQLET